MEPIEGGRSLDINHRELSKKFVSCLTRAAKIQELITMPDVPSSLLTLRLVANDWLHLTSTEGGQCQYTNMTHCTSDVKGLSLNAKKYKL